MTLPINEIISYQDIVKHANTIDKTKNIKVLLSKRQAKLLQRKLKLLFEETPRRTGFHFLAVGELVMIQLLIFTTCPKLALLADYYEVDRSLLRRIEFAPQDGGILVTVHPKNFGQGDIL